ncbi:MAG: hypothetical protein Q8O19_02690 [Rectinemataceae bacterium]|nr:hypothetical protein [Rectinemataceae bacterium]
MCFIICSQLNAKTLFLAHFDEGVKPEVAANPDASVKGEAKIHPEGNGAARWMRVTAGNGRGACITKRWIIINCSKAPQS